MEKNRDDFTNVTKNIIAKRAGYICSNPSCHKLTIMPSGKKIVCIGVAAHICAAAKGGPRYNSTMSKEERKSQQNGIWLCQTCSNYIDKDEEEFTIEVLKKWKKDMENLIAYNFNQTIMLEKENKLDYVFDLLKVPTKWERLADEEYGYYYSDNPAYTISVIQDDKYGNPEFYSWLVYNQKTTYGCLYVRYNGICIFSTPTVCLDSGRMLTVIPESGFVILEGTPTQTIRYLYFIKESNLLILKNFLISKENSNIGEYKDALRKFEEVITVFDSIEDKEEFDYHYHDIYYLQPTEIEEYEEGYDNCGYNDLEKEKNKLQIALGKFVKAKYFEVRNLKK